jgi:acid phosphatase
VAAKPTNPTIKMKNNLKSFACVVSVLLAVLSGRAATTLTAWNFDNLGLGASASPAPSAGFGAATVVGITNSAPDIQGLLGSSGGNTNCWRVRGAGAGGIGWSTNAAVGSQGAKFAASTAGYYKIKVAFDVYATSDAEANLQVQYTTDGAIWNNVTVTSIGSGATITNNTATNATVLGSYVKLSPGWNNQITVDLTGVSGVDNDANFAVRFVNASTGTNCVAVAGGFYNNVSGDWTFDNVTIQGTTIDAITTWTFESYGVSTNSAGVITNVYHPIPEFGSGTATSIGFDTTFHFADGTVGSTNAPDTLVQAGSSTPSGTICWRVRGQGPGNGWFTQSGIGTQGAEFDVSTVNYNDVVLSFDLYFTTQGEAKMQVLYTTNGVTWTNAPSLAYGANPTFIQQNLPSNIDPPYSQDTVTGTYFYQTTGQNWYNNLVVDFTGVPGVANNPNFGVRIVNAAQNGDCVAFNGGSYNNSSGNCRYDNVSFGGTYTGSTPPALTYDPSATVDGPFTNKFAAADPTWLANITAVYVNGAALTNTAFATNAAGLIFYPANSPVLQVSGFDSIVIYATGYSSVKVAQPVVAGVASKFSIAMQPVGPTASGGTLVANPILAITDQYGNGATNPYPNLAVTAATGTPGWTLGGATNQPFVGGFATYTNLTASLTGSKAITTNIITFTVTNLNGNFSNGFAGLASAANQFPSNSAKFTIGVAPVPFTPGNLAVLQLDTFSNNTTFSVIEVKPATPGQTAPVNIVPISATGSNALRLCSSGSCGKLSLSDDGSTISFLAFQDGSSATPDETLNLNRAVGTLNYTNLFTMPASYVSDSLGGSQPRSCATFDNLNWYVCDKGGLYYGNGLLPFANINAYNNVVVRTFGGKAYVETQKTANGVPISVVYGLSNDNSYIANNLVTDPVASDFYLVSTNGGSTYDILYVLDGVSSAIGIIKKYSWRAGADPINNYGWALNGSFTNGTGGDSLFATTNGTGGVYLYYTTAATSKNSIIRVADTNGWNQPFGLGSSNVIYTAPGNTYVKGLTFVPQTNGPAQLTPPPSLVGPTGITTNSASFIMTALPDDPAWRSAITSIVVNGTNTLPPAAYSVQAGAITFNLGVYLTNYALPSGTTMGTETITISTTGYSTNSGTQLISAAPAVTTLGGSNLVATAATMYGTVNPNNAKSFYWFVYGTNNSTAFTNLTTTNSVSAGTSTSTVTNLLGGLLPGTKYFFQLIATNAAGTTLGVTNNFTTPNVAPTVVTLAASNVVATAATLDGSVNPGGGATTNWFKLGTNTTTAFANTVSNTVAAGNSVVVFTNLSAGLLPNTTYYFQAFAANSAGSGSGVTNSFTTAMLPLTNVVFLGAAAGDASSSEATLWTRAVDTNAPIALALTAQVSTDLSFGSGVTAQAVSTDTNKDYTAKITVSSLAPSTKYYYRFVYTNSAVTNYSLTGTFKTAPTPGAAVAVHFAFSGDMDGLMRPYALASRVPNENLDFYLNCGDVIYETASAVNGNVGASYTNSPSVTVSGDSSSLNGVPTAGTAWATRQQLFDDYNKKYREQFLPVNAGGQSCLQSFYAGQGNYTLNDNHELGNRQYINGGAPAGGSVGGASGADMPTGRGVDARYNGSGNVNNVNDTNGSASDYMNRSQGFQTLQQVYLSYQPVKDRGTNNTPADPRTHTTKQLYFAQQWGKNAVYIHTDARSYRDLRLKTADGSADDCGPRADNANRTYLGVTQLAWLQQQLLAAQTNGTPWKFVALSDPIDQIGPISQTSGQGALSTVTASAMQPYSGNVNYKPVNADGGKSYIGGYRAERNALFKFIADNNIRNVVFLATDDHQNRINEVTYSPTGATAMQSSYVKVPYCFSIVCGPLGATGPDLFLNHSFASVKGATDLLYNAETNNGIEPIGLMGYPGLHDIYREGDANANLTPQAADFYSPDTFNYNVLDVSADGKTLTVTSKGINSTAQNAAAEYGAGANTVRTIFSFQVDAASDLAAIDHFIVVYQENWSFDSLYGYFPGANGIANATGASTNQLDRITGVPLALEAGLNNYNNASKTSPAQNTPPQPLNSAGAIDSNFPADLNTLLPYNAGNYVDPTNTTGDIVHRYWQEQFQIDHGSNDLFVSWSDNPGLVMSYYDASTMPEGLLAQQYVMCDNFFHSAFGGSFLNHQWLVAAQSPVYPNGEVLASAKVTKLDANGLLLTNANGRINQDQWLTPSNGVVFANPSQTFGKNYAVNTAISQNLANGNNPTAATFLPSQNDSNPSDAVRPYIATIGDRLDGAGINWKWYSGGWNRALAITSSNPTNNSTQGVDSSISLFQWHHQPLAYYDNYAPWTNGVRNPRSAAHLQDENNFFQDVTNNTLPSVCFIKPLGPDNEHPGYASLMQGQLHVSNIVAAVQANPALWAHTAIIITYDEHGGRWDHVAPPVRDIWGPGVRVPGIIISPLAKSNYVDHTQYETLSILKTIEQRFGLAPLTAADANAASLAPAFNGSVASTAEPAMPPTLTSATAGGVTHLTWPANYGVYVLQSATNILGPWTVINMSSNAFDITVDPTKSAVYYRLIRP